LHSRRFAVVVSQYPSQTFAALDFPSLLSDFIVRFDDSVGKALVISFFVIMPDEGFDSPMLSSSTICCRTHGSRSILTLDAAGPSDCWKVAKGRASIWGEKRLKNNGAVRYLVDARN